MNNIKKKWFGGIRSGKPLHSTPTLYHMRYFGSCEMLFKASAHSFKRLLHGF